MPCTLFLDVAFIACVYGCTVTTHRAFQWCLTLAILLYICKLVELCTCSTLAFLGNVNHASNALNMVNEIKANPPKVELYIQNYHYDRTGNNNRTRVNTHLAREPYRFLEWID